MAKFIYKMQNILNVKEKLEEQAKTVYGEARAKLNEEEEKLALLEKKKDIYEDKLRGKISQSLKINDIIKCEEAIDVLKISIDIQNEAVVEAEERLERARQQLNQAMIERKTHEKLRENAFETFKFELKSEEKKEVDELVSFKYNSDSNSEDDK